jgi:hypothetical protein
MSAVNLCDENFFFPARVKNSLKTILGLSFRGPEKVRKNLTLGLKNLGLEVILNKAPIDLSRVCSVLSGKQTVKKLLESGVKKLVLGPNLTAQDMAEIFQKYEKNLKTILAPSKEVRFVYSRLGIPEEIITVWPVGIDTREFADTTAMSKTTNALVYFKRRNKTELSEVLEILKKTNQSYKIISYGSYTESEFKTALKNCQYAVILDGTESQGIAVQEIMSCNLPLFVFDQIYLGEIADTALKENLQVTSVPYWSESCGVKVSTDMFGKSKNPYLKISETLPVFQDFLKQLGDYKPRKYILDNLDLNQRTKQFLSLIS